jgi:hypothetical protein
MSLLIQEQQGIENKEQYKHFNKKGESNRGIEDNSLFSVLKIFG